MKTSLKEMSGALSRDEMKKIMGGRMDDGEVSCSGKACGANSTGTCSAGPMGGGSCECTEAPSKAC